MLVEFKVFPHSHNLTFLSGKQQYMIELSELSKKAVLAIGGLVTAVGLGWLITRAKGQPQTVQVSIKSNPIRTIILVDGKTEVTTPQVILLKPGLHKFNAISVSPDLLVTYGFNYWQVNGRAISYAPTIELNIRESMVLTAQYMMVEAGRYPLISGSAST